MSEPQRIILARGQTALVDEEDYPRLSKHKWYLSTFGYVVRAGPRKNGWQTKIYMHREVMSATEGMVVDHIRPDNKLDNRKSNLRPATVRQNGANRRVNQGEKTSRYKGVCWLRRLRKWRAYIGQRSISLGVYVSEEEAAHVYDRKAKELYGEFALLNFPAGEQFVRDAREIEGV